MVSLTSLFKTKSPYLQKDDLKHILSTPYPEGLCNHAYTGGFGTVWTCIFDLVDQSVEICFGAPTHNDWRIKTFKTDPVGFTTYNVIFPNLNR